MTPTARKWVEQAQYDLETARAMMAKERWLYVLFCCQQTLEKALKALIVSRTGEFPPRIHNLARLSEVAGLAPDATRDLFLGELSAYYIQARYPEEIDAMADAATRDLAGETLKKTEEAAQWLFSMTQ
jgi:HEPN domain-containing protein